MEAEFLKVVSELSVGGIFAVVLIKQVFDFLKSRKETNQSSGHDSCIPADEWREFYTNWQHQKFDETNNLRILAEISENIKEQTKVLNILVTEGKVNTEALRHVSQDLASFRKIEKH